MTTEKFPEPPEAYREFIQEYPELGDAWQLLNQAGQKGPLDEKMQRLLKLAIAMGAMREGAVNSNVRKSLAMGVTKQELLQIVSLCAGTLGLPATVALYTWVKRHCHTT